MVPPPLHAAATCVLPAHSQKELFAWPYVMNSLSQLPGFHSQVPFPRGGSWELVGCSGSSFVTGVEHLISIHFSHHCEVFADSMCISLFYGPLISKQTRQLASFPVWLLGDRRGKFCLSLGFRACFWHFPKGTKDFSQVAQVIDTVLNPPSWQKSAHMVINSWA